MVDQVLALDGQQRWMLLAPVVRERKGEHVQVFEQLRAQGYVRVRVDGVVHEIDAVPPLALRVKHTIEAVIDRFRPREDLKQRLAESFETALKLGDGMATVMSLDQPNEPAQLFSSKYSCPLCDYALPELEPRLFSFNAPMGACSGCDGLGVAEFFDPSRVVTHPELSLAAGAVRGWDRRNAYYFQLIASLARHYGFDVDAPWYSRRSCMAAAKSRSTSPTSPRPAAVASASTVLKAWFRTCSGATAKLNRPPCARSWPSTFPSAPARNATARA